VLEQPQSKLATIRNWWIDELAHAGKEHLDASYVAAYERKAGYDPTEDLVSLKQHGLGSESVLVDLGAGTGGFALAAARICRHVIAVEVSPAMTALLRNRLQELEIGNVTVVDAGFLSYEHQGERPGFVFTRNALHHLPDFWKVIALARIRELLQPGGILRLGDLVFDFEPFEASEKIEAWLAGAVGDPSLGYTSAELAEHVRVEFSTYSWLLEAMLEKTKFDVLDRRFSRFVYGSYTCAARRT
jgi:SAM-dependent methyltransferase